MEQIRIFDRFSGATRSGDNLSFTVVEINQGKQRITVQPTSSDALAGNFHNSSSAVFDAIPGAKLVGSNGNGGFHVDFADPRSSDYD